MKAIRKVLVGVASVSAFGALLVWAGQPRFSCEAEPVKVEYGDTLWAIAERNCEGEISFVVDFLVDQYGATIHSGQLVWLPLDYADTKSWEG